MKFMVVGLRFRVCGLRGYAVQMGVWVLVSTGSGCVVEGLGCGVYRLGERSATIHDIGFASPGSRIKV